MDCDRDRGPTTGHHPCLWLALVFQRFAHGTKCFPSSVFRLRSPIIFVQKANRILVKPSMIGKSTRSEGNLVSMAVRKSPNHASKRPRVKCRPEAREQDSRKHKRQCLRRSLTALGITLTTARSSSALTRLFGPNPENESG